jgi:putative endonuclease
MELLSRIWIEGPERGMAGLDWMVRHSGRAQARAADLVTGLEGEDAAYFFLRRKGYTVAARRWSPGHERGDIDLIAWDGTLLCIVEVKTRTAHDMAPAESSVDYSKRRMLRRLARQYVRQLSQTTAPQVRFDVVSVYLVPGREKEFVHFESAFGWSERRNGSDLEQFRNRRRLFESSEGWLFLDENTT